MFGILIPRHTVLVLALGMFMLQFSFWSLRFMSCIVIFLDFLCVNYFIFMIPFATIVFGLLLETDVIFLWLIGELIKIVKKVDLAP